MPRVNVSVKLSALYSQFDPIDPDGTSRRRPRPAAADPARGPRSTGRSSTSTWSSTPSRTLTLRIFREVLDEDEFRDWPDVGIAIQAYLRDTRATTCSELLDWAERRGTPVWVRLVKGAYWDYETVIAAQNGWPVPVFDARSGRPTPTSSG